MFIFTNTANSSNLNNLTFELVYCANTLNDGVEPNLPSKY